MYSFKTIQDAYSEAKKYNKYQTTAPFPPYVTIELLNDCNFRCRMCALTYQEHHGNHMPISRLKDVIRQIAQYGSMVRFIGFCEPLMYRHIKEAVEYVKNYGLLLHLTTNASLLTKEMSAFLVNAGLDSIIYSFQGGSKEEYMYMRSLGGPIYERVMENIRYFQSIKTETQTKITTTITLRDSKKDVEKFIEESRGAVDEVQVSGFTHFVHVADHFGEMDIWGELGIARPKMKENARCFLPNYEMLVKPDGSACACCGAYTESICYGNVFEDDIMDVWRGGKAEKLRTKICSGDIENIENCSVCPVRYRYDTIENSVFNTRG